MWVMAIALTFVSIPAGASGLFTHTATSIRMDAHSKFRAGRVATSRAPTLKRLSTTKGSSSGRTAITIVGTNFEHVRDVLFGGTRVRSVRVTSSTRLSVVSPAHSAGTVNIRVTTTYGTTKVVAADRYTFVIPSNSPPALDSSVPSVKIGPLPTPFVPSSWSGPNPPGNCDTAGSRPASGIEYLDFCGAKLEGLAPLSLPSNWANLSDPERGFVLMNLERIERGETPIVGISTTLNNYAAEGADSNTDPPVSFISDGVGGSIWASGSFVAVGMPGFLYADGPGGFNLDCTSTDASGCWGHRDNILDASANPHLAVGVADGSSGDSAAVISDQYSDFNFSWSTELNEGYPNGLPSDFVLAPPSVTAITGNGDSTIKLSGAGLDTGSAVYFSNIRDSNALTCTSPDACQVGIPSGLAPNTTYNVYVLNSAGLSTKNQSDQYSTAP
jgi:hypothetical protein